MDYLLLILIHYFLNLLLYLINLVIYNNEQLKFCSK